MAKRHPIDRLRDIQLKQLSKAGSYADGRGLYFKIDPTGSKSWVFRYMHQGRRHSMGLGGYPDTTLAEARESRDHWRKILKGTITTPPRDPLEVKRELEAAHKKGERKLITFDEVAAKFISANRPSWSSAKHAQQWENSLRTYANPIIGNMDIADIDTEDILKVLEPIWTTKTETASRVRGRMEKVIDYARARKQRTEENPARWRGHLDALLAKPTKVTKVKHYASLPYQQVGSFISALRALSSTNALALEFLILTNTRSGDVLESDWSEIDLPNKQWIISAHRLKTRKEHTIPLSNRAIEILEDIANEQTDGLIFRMPKGGQLGNGDMADIIKNMNDGNARWVSSDGDAIVPHGFRSTFRTWAGECTSFPRDLIEFAMGHQLKDKAEASYHRSTLPEKRRKLMNDWANRLSTPDKLLADVVVIGTVKKI